MREGWVRPRWHEWVIALSIAALFVIGVAAIWGAPIVRLVDRLGGEVEEEETLKGIPVPAPTGQRL